MKKFSYISNKIYFNLLIQFISENNEFDKKSSYFGYLVITLNDKVVGYALYCYAYSTWEGKSMYLLEFYVSPNEHKANIRSDLFSAVAKVR